MDVLKLLKVRDGIAKTMNREDLVFWALPLHVLIFAPTAIMDSS